MTDIRDAPIIASVSFTASNKPGKSLGLNVRSQECKAGWRIPSIRYAISRFEIEFEMIDCIAPEEDWASDVINTFDGEIEHQTALSTTANEAFENVWAAATTTASTTAKAGTSRQKSASTASKLSTKHTPIIANGDSNRPKWTITSERPIHPLLGTLIRYSHFCRIEPTGPNPSIRISYTIPYDALLFRRNDGSFASSTKLGIIRLLLRSAICEKKSILIEEKVE